MSGQVADTSLEIYRWKEHKREYKKKWRNEHRDKIYLYGKKYAETHREKLHLHAKQYRERHREKIKRRRHERYINRITVEHQKHREWIRKHPDFRHDKWRELRNAILARLGSKCVACGNIDSRVLCIDHINGGGTKERRLLGASGFMLKLKKLSDDELKRNYQLLCANCNMIKTEEQGENRKI
jgi:hypothetical protein